ncbi:hypothetical protein BJX63DRAFT_385126 [Aspergillus granulosus]|uniref:Uncharacterized protein n=1 Tax=Aspergillus granulosus TaxID=176169 RepID=A0ABR4HR18_9EURO
MSFGGPAGGITPVKPTPPERGSFPLDHDGNLPSDPTLYTDPIPTLHPSIPKPKIDPLLHTTPCRSSHSYNNHYVLTKMNRRM